MTNILLVATTGSSVAEPLPPAPPPEQSKQQNRQQYEFQAPTTPKSNFPSNSTTDRLYRVQINNTSYVSLFLVRGVEPDAFIPENRNIIQAGLFSKQSNAKQLVKTLSQRGIDAEIVTVSK